MILAHSVYLTDEEITFRGSVALSCLKEELGFKLSTKAEALPSSSLPPAELKSSAPFSPLRHLRDAHAPGPASACPSSVSGSAFVPLVATIYEDADWTGARWMLYPQQQASPSACGVSHHRCPCPWTIARTQAGRATAAQQLPRGGRTHRGLSVFTATDDLPWTPAGFPVWRCRTN